MVKHIVMWTLSAEDTAVKNEQFLKIKGLLDALVGVVPGLLKMEVAQNHKPGYDLGLYSEFTDWKALEGYDIHPEHQKVREYINTVRSDRGVFDFEV